jgi:hypothetical protein
VRTVAVVACAPWAFEVFFGRETGKVVIEQGATDSA